jgi:hypothetical protein
MDRPRLKLAAAMGTLGVLALTVTVFAGCQAQTQAPAVEPEAAQAQVLTVDPEAVEILRRSMDYLGSLQQFTMHARNMHEDILDSGNKVNFGAAGSLTVSRPDKLRAERHGAQFQQTFYYDGTTLTLHNSPDNVYASDPAPGTLPEMFDFASDSLELYIPLTDLFRPDVFPLLMEDVTMAMVVGKDIVGDVTCDHLLFSRPGVDFQICVADSGPPLPVMYVVTDTGTPALLSVVTIMSDWDIAPTVPADWFTFVPTAGATEVPFLK